MLNEKGAKLLKEVIIKKYKNVKLDSIHADDNEFYYEFKAKEEISEKDLEKLENEIQKIDNELYVKLLRVSRSIF